VWKQYETQGLGDIVNISVELPSTLWKEATTVSTCAITGALLCYVISEMILQEIWLVSSAHYQGLKKSRISACPFRQPAL